ncbi:MAG: amidoligase family protein [Candidatus Kapabacteria bacterium]|nr:amidoligase family protein [Candidatus Kapabacteria bacterium]
MTAQEIINSTQTKTAKMLALFELGHTRVEVAQMLGVGYGFVQNVYARRYNNNATQARAGAAYNWTGFTHKFGVEIEAHGVNKEKLIRALNTAGIECVGESYNHETRNHWKVVSDNSLSGDNPFELVSPPLVGQEGLNQLQIVCRVLNDMGAMVNKSCGLHIHFDANGFDLNTWKNLYLNYAELEESLDSILPASRRANTNNYCKSIKTRGYRTAISGANSLREIEDAITSRSRYYKLNTQSFWRQRTVEFRQHSGTVEYEKISNWILLLAQLIEFSKTQSVTNGNFETLKSILQHEQQTYIQERHDKFARQ